MYIVYIAGTDRGMRAFERMNRQKSEDTLTEQ